MKYHKLFNVNWILLIFLTTVKALEEKYTLPDLPVLKRSYNEVYDIFSKIIVGNKTNLKKQHLKFPDGFLIGCGTSAFQSEGAWNEDGKLASSLDFASHSKIDFFIDGSTGDVACDSYHKYKEDVRLIKNTGFDVYRFSVSWTRILPTGEENNVNEAGIQFYRNLIDELLANNIKPMVALHDWEMPLPILKLGGWYNRITADYFERFCRIVFSRLGDKVKLWTTITDPKFYSEGKISNITQPFVNATGESYLIAHNYMLGHAKAYRLYDKEFRKFQNGKIGISLGADFAIPETDSDADKEAAERYMQFYLGYFLHPIYSKQGDYPPIMREIIDQNSRMEGRYTSRLPKFTISEINDLKGSSDFIGVIHYSSFLTRFGDNPLMGAEKDWYSDIGIHVGFDQTWPNTTKHNWMRVVPQGFRGVLNWIKNEYDNPYVIITENGFPDYGETVVDNARINYFQAYLRELLAAIHEDKCNVRGYVMWSFMDLLEWTTGDLVKFGIYHVDYQNKNRTRTPKKSAKYFQEILKTRTLPDIFL